MKWIIENGNVTYIKFDKSTILTIFDLHYLHFLIISSDTQYPKSKMQHKNQNRYRTKKEGGRDSSQQRNVTLNDNYIFEVSECMALWHKENHCFLTAPGSLV